MRKIIVLILTLFALVFSLGTASASAYAGKWYQVELIIFSHITAQGLNSEQWPWTSTWYQPKSETITLDTNSSLVSADSLLPFVVLPSRALDMKREIALIREKPEYHIVLHLAWCQQIRTSRYALPIHVFGGNIYNSAGKVIATDTDGQMPYSNNEIWQVNGTIKISVRRYLNVGLNLLFADPAFRLSNVSNFDMFDNIQGKFAYFRLLQSRRMRSEELNYIGHPLYGVVIKVVPLKEKDRDEQGHS